MQHAVFGSVHEQDRVNTQRYETLKEKICKQMYYCKKGFFVLSSKNPSFDSCSKQGGDLVRELKLG